MARPPDASKQNAVVKEASFEAMYATSAPSSDTNPHRPIGILAVMYATSRGGGITIRGPIYAKYEVCGPYIN